MRNTLDLQFQTLVPGYKDALQLLQERNNIRIRPLQQLTGGRTGALLYLVGVSVDSAPIEHLVLKLDRPAKWAGDGRSEPEQHRLAAKLAPQSFAKDHMVTVAYTPTEAEGALAVLYTVAGGSLQRCRPLASYAQQSQLEQIYSELGSGLLEEWNGDRIESMPNVHPQCILQDWLGYRLDAEQGHICRFLQDECDIEADGAGLVFGGRILPNPYAYACRRDPWENARPLDVLRGLQHGDLNANNVLVEFSQYGGDLQGYYLIDFANFTESSFLFYDHAYLELSYLLRQAARVSADTWTELVRVLALTDVPSPRWVPAELAGACTVIRSMRREIESWIAQHHPTLRDDLWGLYRLAGTAAGLNFCNKRSLSREDRFAAFVYAAVYLRQQCDYFDVPSPKHPKELILTEEKLPTETGSAWEPFLEACHGFDRERTYILVTGPDLRDRAHLMSALGRVHWSLVLDFDPNTQAGGLYEHVRQEIEGRCALHSITCEDSISASSSRASYWYAARGLAGRANTFPSGDGWLAWKLKYSAALTRVLRELATSCGEQPGTCVIIWNEPEYARKICDLITDTFGDRMDLILAAPALQPMLEIGQAYNCKMFSLRATEIAAGLGKLFRRFYFERGRISLPATDRRGVVLKRRDTVFLEEEMTLLHLDIGMRDDREGGIKSGFLRGEEISWLELSLHRDVDRNKTDELKEQVKRDLSERLTTRINLYHRPGAGGTTIARRIAWELHRTYPTVLLHRVSAGTVGRLQSLRQLTSSPILVIAESADFLLDDLENLYSAVRTEHLAVVFLIVSRRFQSVRREEERVRYLRERLDADEGLRFADAYGREKPQRSAVLRELALNEEKRRFRVPFYFGLTAFDDDFAQLDTYVRARLEEMSETEEKIMVYLALAYRYAQQTLPAQMFSHLLGLVSTSKVHLDKALDKRRQSLLVRSTKRGEPSWRPSHQLIAIEICEQILAGDAVDRRSWRENLSTWAIQLVEDCAALYEHTNRLPSARIVNLLARLFVLRDSRDILGIATERPHFAQLVKDIGLPEGQLPVLTALVAHFPEEAHFWAHLGRYLSWQGDHAKALEAIEKSIELDEEDHVLHHMKGMALRNRAYDLMDKAKAKARSGEVVADQSLDQIRRLWLQAENEFATVREMAPADEHSYVSHIQLLARAVEFGREMSAEPTYASFLTDQRYLEYHEKVEAAEGLLEDAKRLRGGERQRLSRYVAGCEVRINEVVGDYSKVIEGWAKLLKRPDVYKPSVRRRLVFAYLGRRNRSWDSLHQGELDEIVKLMAENILSEPDNDRNIRLWFEAGRRSPSVTIESAIERLSYWRARGDSIDAIYYSYVLQALRAIEGSAMAREKARQLVEECRRKARHLQYRTRSYDWLGIGAGLTCLVHYSRLGKWDREEDFWTNVEPLTRIPGLIARIDRPEAGLIELESGLKAFFVPGRSRAPREHVFKRERHENRRVTFFLGFSYDGLRAWSVRLEQGDEEES